MMWTLKRLGYGGLEGVKACSRESQMPFARSMQALEDKDIITPEIEWKGLIDARNSLSEIKGLKSGI